MVLLLLLLSSMSLNNSSLHRRRRPGIRLAGTICGSLVVTTYRIVFDDDNGDGDDKDAFLS
jgi:hypothetical protein